MALDCGCIYIQWTPTTIDGTFGAGDYFPQGEYNGKRTDVWTDL